MLQQVVVEAIKKIKGAMFMKIAIAGEGCSFPLMKKVKKYLISKGYEVLDLGMTDEKEPYVLW